MSAKGEDVAKVIEEADAAINQMVDFDLENYLGHLERGHYYQKFGRTPKERETAEQDLMLAKKKNPKDPRVYIELAQLARSSKDDKEANRVIEEGLKVLPGEPALHLERARLAGSIDKVIASLRHSVDLIPGQIMLRVNLANLLAQTGDTVNLHKEISELRRTNLSKFFIEILEARYLINRQEWEKAISTLVLLQPESPEQQAQVYDLQARCYRNLAYRPRQNDALKYRDKERQRWS